MNGTAWVDRAGGIIPRRLRLSVTWRTVALTLPGVAAFLVACVVLFIHAPGGQGDAMAYWGAAMRLREGQELYPPVPDLLAGDVYRYAPWFAVLWIPFTYLPLDAVMMGWFLLQLAVGVLTFAWLLRHGPEGFTLACIMAYPTVIGVLSGNAQVLMHFALVWLVASRWSGAVIGVLASMKAYPILLLIVHLRRGEWRQALIGVVVASLLVAPMLLFDLSNYPTTASTSDLSLWTRIPWLAMLLAGALLVATWLFGRTRYGWTLGGMLVLVAMPQAWVAYIPMMLTGLRPDADDLERA